MTIYPSKSWSEEFLMLFFFGHFLQVFPAQIASLQLEIFEILSKNWFLEQVSAKRFFCETLDILGVPNISHISMALENIAAHHQIRIEPQIPIQYPVPEVGPFSSIRKLLLKMRKNDKVGKEPVNKAQHELELHWKFGFELFFQVYIFFTLICSQFRLYYSFFISENNFFSRT